MALKNRKHPNNKLIHQANRGFYYYNSQNTEFAKNSIMISMTEQYNPCKNVIAERINRILKYECGVRDSVKNSDIA
jgi:transposase InsO family protein